MTLYPEVQARAQQEIDTVVGRDRLATFEDRKQLPYLSNVVKEAFRWRPSVPLCTQRVRHTPSNCMLIESIHTGVPHTTMADDQYRGMHIPKGASVVANIWYA